MIVPLPFLRSFRKHYNVLSHVTAYLLEGAFIWGYIDEHIYSFIDSKNIILLNFIRSMHRFKFTVCSIWVYVSIGRI